ncbi:hypothetical protein Ahy_A03g016720 isoform B [Arachis hypogaea]|uniref:Uncharacterized protein n=1 Tax=Arachis hypogaea TaxID=3818 RepID=A0A445E4B5_ARAHY|nr:hypothetical protein Ahy_A03g016720 isoform B [Arachis hypogaea]
MKNYGSSCEGVGSVSYWKGGLCKSPQAVNHWNSVRRRAIGVAGGALHGACACSASVRARSESLGSGEENWRRAVTVELCAKRVSVRGATADYRRRWRCAIAIGAAAGQPSSLNFWCHFPILPSCNNG